MSALPALRVSDNQRFLVTAESRPFFWLGDTAWNLLQRLTREEAERYLQNRAGLGFTVIQTVALAEPDGDGPNAYGDLALSDNDPDKPNERYFAHVDWVISRANELGMYVGMLPTWGDHWNTHKWGDFYRGGPEIFTPLNAAAYGVWLGRRYRDAGVVWILGGDRLVESDVHREIVRAMALGLRDGDGGRHLITFHPPGRHGSAEWFHDEDWLDFNMRQNGHAADFNNGRYEMTRADYDRTPVKPVLDGEPLYEDHVVAHNQDLEVAVAADVRRALYWNLFAGACGHTYGHHSVWQMWDEGRERILNAPMPWQDGLDQPGAAHMRHARRLLESRPFLTRMPDPGIIVPATNPGYIPGRGRYHFTATRDAEGSYAMVYAPVGRTFTVRLDRLSGSRTNAWWFDPRTGAATSIGTFARASERTFTPPAPGEVLDWVLVLDDADRRFPPPGATHPGVS